MCCRDLKEILQRPLMQQEIRKMLREEQAKSRPLEAEAMKKSPSLQSEVRKERSESEEAFKQGVRGA